MAWAGKQSVYAGVDTKDLENNKRALKGANPKHVHINE